MSVITTNELTKSYGEVTAIKDLTLDIGEGEVFGFLGPNGAGKSTTINVLLDLVSPTAGSATILGHDSQENTREIHRQLGVLPEGYDLYDRLSGRRHLRFAAATKQADDDPDEIFERVGLDREDADRAVGEYSKGMKQRLALGMALTGSPELLILDEPSAGLDPSGIQRMQDIVRTEADRGTTVFFSSHILGQVEAVCDRVGVLNHGELVAIDTIEGLREAVGSAATVTLELDSVPDSALSSLSDIDGVTGYDITARNVAVQCGNPRAKARVINHVEAAGSTVLDIHVEETGLHALFEELTGTEGSSGEPDEGGVIA